jgi:hypothetical protein
MVLDVFSGRLGIGTTSPYSMLSVAGQVVATNYIATSSSATSTFPAISFNVFAWAGSVFSSFSSAFTSSSGVLSSVTTPSFTYATSTAWTGTTTITLQQGINPWTLNGTRCQTDVGTLNIQFGIGTASTTMLNASSTNNFNAFTANNSIAAGNTLKIDIGTPASAPTRINCTTKNTM